MSINNSMSKRAASADAGSGRAKKSSRGSAANRWAYVTARVTSRDGFPDGKIDATERALLKAGFRVDEERDVEYGQDGGECDMTHFYFGHAGHLTAGGAGWTGRVRRTVHSVFEANHSALSSIAVATRDEAVISVVSWSCLRNRNNSLCTSIKADDATGARVVILCGKKRVVQEQENEYNIETDKEAFMDSYDARCHVPDRLKREIA